MTLKPKITSESSNRKHMTVRIPKGMTETIEDFLKTEQAAKMGFDSKTDVVTAAVRRLLIEHGH
jgi:Arc/MetJ-type ribon-helix-helix transcriptional regulator